MSDQFPALKRMAAIDWWKSLKPKEKAELRRAARGLTARVRAAQSGSTELFSDNDLAEVLFSVRSLPRFMAVTAEPEAETSDE